MVRERKSISLLTVGCPVLRNFRSFIGLVGGPFGVALPVPVISGETESERLSFVKDFCGGLLERPREHLWYGPTKGLGADARVSIAMSLFLFRKVLPSTAPSLLEYAQRMSKPSPDPDEGFVRFVVAKVRKIFRKGWDKGLYESAALNATLPSKACRQAGYADGGARMYGLKNRWDSHEEYALEVLTRESPFELCPSSVISVETGGKHRIVSKSDVTANLFRPLHTSMYNHLSKFRWLLRGEAKASSFKEFCYKPGEIFTSGDYESATDNLNGRLQRLLLEIILDQTESVPAGIRDSASQMLRSVLEVKDSSGNVETYCQERGQLMGNLLSFPLLCLINYLGFRYYCGDYPVRVNGDDIVFRAPQEASDRWMEGVSGCGLTLSKGKTMVNSRYFSLNSTMFKAHRGRIEVIPMIRSTAFGYRPECGGVETLAGRWKSFAPHFFGDRRSNLRIQFLKWNRKYVLASRRSLSRGLGISVRKEELIGANLWERECFYLSLPEGVEKPLPVKPSRLDQERKPKGWSLQIVNTITKEIREKAKEAGPAFVECAWSRPEGLTEMPTDKEWQRQVRETGYAWGGASSMRSSPFSKEPSSLLLRNARLLGLSARNTGRFLRPRLTRFARETDDDVVENDRGFKAPCLAGFVPARSIVRPADRPRVEADVCRLRECDISEIQKKNRRRMWLPDGFMDKIPKTTLLTGTANASRSEINEMEKGMDTECFRIDGPIVSYDEDDARMHFGVSQVRIYNNGRGLGYGPPQFFPRAAAAPQ